MSVTRPVVLAGESGVTRNISASGVFFEADVDYAPGSKISFEIELDGPQGKAVMKARGEIVRIEVRGSKVGIGVRITASKLE